MSAAVRIERCELQPLPGHPTCNPPAPRPVNARIIAVAAAGAATVVTISKGERDGIDRRWRAELVTPTGTVLQAFEILKVGAFSSTLRLSGTDLLRPDVQVRLTPP